MKQDKDNLLYFMIALVAAIFLHFSFFHWVVDCVLFAFGICGFNCIGCEIFPIGPNNVQHHSKSCLCE